MTSLDFSLLQKHTVEIYHLREHQSDITHVRARMLLKPQRFDLFAKLFYIENRQTDHARAMAVYSAHIKAFNPDEKEPGRSDKNGLDDFVAAFDDIIDHFKDHDYDETQSVVPVDKNGVILDGAHRVSALAYYDKDVTIAVFRDVEAKCDFDYEYFIDRGMARSICDIVAYEMTRRCDTMLVACLWPRLGNEASKSLALQRISQNHQIAYCKKLIVNQKSMTRFVREIYQSQSWTKNPQAVQDKAVRIYGNGNHRIWCVFFESGVSLDNILQEKEQLRAQFGFAKDSVHMTDNAQETEQIAYLSLTQDGLSEWKDDLSRFRFDDVMAEKWHYFKKVTWMNLKTKIWRLLH